MSHYNYNRRGSLLSIILLVFGLLAVNACKKKEKTTETPTPVQPVTPSPLPVVSTSTVKEISDNSAMVVGNVSSEGTSALTMIGICWDVNPAPTTLRSRTFVGAGTGTFVSKMDSLKPSTTYYVRAYATNFSGTAYGNEISFKTPPVWQLVKSLFQQSINCVITDGGNVFIGEPSGFSKSTDNGLNWTYSNTGLNNTDLRCLVMKGSTIFAGTPSGISRSTNMGDTWASINSGLTNFNITSLVVKDSKIFAATANGVFVSANDGGSWTKVSNGLGFNMVQYLAVSGNNLYALSYYASDKIYTSSDDGANWAEFSDYFTSGNTNYGIGGSASKLFVAAKEGLYLNNGNTWDKVSGITSEMTCVYIQDQFVYAGGKAAELSFLVSTNQGNTFTTIKNPGMLNGFDYVASIAANQDYIFAACRGLYRYPLK